MLTALDTNRVHWAFYSFREDVWPGMDYELGADTTSLWIGLRRLHRSSSISLLEGAIVEICRPDGAR